MDTNTVYHKSKIPEKFLETADREKKKTYLQACIKKCRHFTPFVVSVDGLLWVEAEATIKRITGRLETKCKDTYLRSCGYVNSRVAIALVRATHHCIEGNRFLSSRISVTPTQWEDSTGVHLFL